MANKLEYALSEERFENSMSNYSSKLRNENEGKLLENAFLISSVVEILTTKPKVDTQLKKGELQLLNRLKILLEQMETEKKYYGVDGTRLTLQPVGVDLLPAVQVGRGYNFPESIRKSLATLTQFEEKPVISPRDKQSINELVNLLRSMLDEIRASITTKEDPLFDDLR